MSAFHEASERRADFVFSSEGATLCRWPAETNKVCSESLPITINSGKAGNITVFFDPENRQTAAGMLNALTAAVQQMADAENARRAVSAETLNAYRELAMLQRTADRLNRELNPEGIGTVLLEETGLSYEGGKVGVVLGCGRNTTNYSLLACRGENAKQIFTSFINSGTCMLFSNMDRVQIINDFDLFITAGSKDYFYRSVMVVPLIDNGSYLGYMLAAAPEGDYYASSAKKRMETISPSAATALHNALLFAEQKALFDSFLNAIAMAIDSKSSYTAGHCKRVPWIANELLLAAHNAGSGKFADFTVTEDEVNEMNVAALLHDCGKIGTPEWVMDKSMKLEGIMDGIEFIRLKMEIYKLNRVIDAYVREKGRLFDACSLEDELTEANDIMTRLENLNRGGENLDEQVLEWLSSTGSLNISLAEGQTIPLLDADELEKLSIKRGTLTASERQIIENHVVKTMQMLKAIKFPENMKNVIYIAACHHEKINGSGYPAGLKGDEISVKGRIIAIADIFEALTAEDRPYKKPGTLSKALDIMGYMVKDGHIDEDLYRLLTESGIHKKYAEAFMPPHLVDI